jgi:hypothetical protein
LATEINTYDKMKNIALKRKFVRDFDGDYHLHKANGKFKGLQFVTAESMADQYRRELALIDLDFAS